MTAILLAAAALCCSTASAQGDAADLAQAQVRYEQLIANGGRYMAQTCAAPRLDYPGYEGLPVHDCVYESLGVRARVLLLLPSAEQLARWTVSACSAADAADMGSCVRRIARQIWRASNAQFPVSGFVIEPSEAVGGRAPAGTPYCTLFRDGVTVSTTSFTTRRATPGSECGPGSAMEEPVLRAHRYARIASTNRAMYRAAGGTEAVGDEVTRDPAWARVTGALFREAWTSDRNFLITAWALDAKARGAIR